MSAADDYRRLLRATERLIADPAPRGANAALIREFVEAATASLELSTSESGVPLMGATFDLTRETPDVPHDLELAFDRALERVLNTVRMDPLTLLNGIRSLREKAVSDDPTVLAEEGRIH